jgi:TPP-dependent pyruvate/acetoin dehydrogenase alpha subunit
MLHAVGLSWASRLRSDGGIALTLFGDGATSEGEFHEAMNLAGVLDAPTVFLCQNNHYAISAHRSIQTRSETIAQKAIAYGMPGYLVDGNDVVAVHAVTAVAVERARAGQGPSLIEALTYRMAPHTTADDPTRYRDAAEEELWRARDPLERVRAYLEREGAWDEGWQAELDERARATIEEAVEAAEGLPAFDPESFFDSTVAELDPILAEQAAAAKHRSESS